MSTIDKIFNTIGTVAVHYARSPVAPYGTLGRQHSFRCTQAFYSKLTTCFTELWRVCPYGLPQAIVSAGAYVNKPGHHGRGHAFDLDAIFWPGRTFITNRFNEYPNFYLGIEAILRKHFGTVLAYNYNQAHHDHFHIDDGSSIGFRTNRSVTLFVQGVCYYIFEKRFSGNVDGRYGPATRTVLDEVCQNLNVPTPLTVQSNWNQFLDVIANHAFNEQWTRPADYDCTRDSPLRQ